MTIEDLRQLDCKPRKGAGDALSQADAQAHLAVLPGWKAGDEGKHIFKEFKFKDYYHTMAFVNALAWIAHAQDHHPDLEVGYASCLVTYSTHDVGGLSLNDFISAAKAESLLGNA